jgi:hypothetical protein
MTRRTFVSLALSLGPAWPSAQARLRIVGREHAWWKAAAASEAMTGGLATLAATGAATRAAVRVGVFGLFHPRALTVRATDAGGLVLRTDGETCVLRGRETAELHIVGGRIEMACAGRARTTERIRIASTGTAASSGSETGSGVGRVSTVGLSIAGADDAAPPGSSLALVELSVPGRITRLFRGQVDVAIASDALVPVVSMDLETAVASIVAAEQIASTPVEALKAQAIAARSYLVASNGRHSGFDFCDTTHCQFLREPPASDRPAAQAARETAGLVLAFRGTPIAAFYSASCGGRTLSLAEIGRPVDDGYPYFSVDCAYCRRHADRQGPEGRHGHGLGLCQVGAADLAAASQAPCADILAHYYPATTLTMVG